MAEFRKIAIFRALQLGDLLCAMPAIKNLRLAYPYAEIVFIGLPSSQRLIERYTVLFDRFISFPGYPGLPEQPFNEQAFHVFSKQVKEEAFDLILQMQGNGTIVNAMLAPLSNGELAGFSIDEAELTQYPLLMPYPSFGHESLRHIALMKHLDVPIVTTEMFFPMQETDDQQLSHFALEANYVCMHCGSRGAWRQWPPAFFAQLADLCMLRNIQVVLTGTAEEIDLIQQVADLMKQEPLIVAGKTDLGSVAALLKRSKGLIANCTGVSHLAAALKVKSVIISMDGEPERWAPLNTDIHHTIDWTKTPDYGLVEQAVVKMLFP